MTGQREIEALRAHLHTVLTRTIQDGVSMQTIAENADVCVQTVSRLYYGETQYPRLSTVVKIGWALGLTMHWSR